MFTDNTRAYDIIESAKILGYTQQTIRYYRKKGLISGKKLGRKLYFSEDELIRFKNERNNKQ